MVPTDSASDSSEQNDLASLKSMVRDFCEAREWDQFHDIKELSIGLITESSELLEMFRFLSRDESEALLGDPFKRIKIEDEIADVFFFLLRIAGRYEIDLAKILKSKIAKNNEKYPVHASRGSNRKYDEI